MENEKISAYKKEFKEDIDAEKITIAELKKSRVASGVLEAEVALHKIFGDEIYVPKKKEEKIEGEKEIIKLSESDIAFDSKVRELCENLADPSFDSNVGVVLSKAPEEE